MAKSYKLKKGYIDSTDVIHEHKKLSKVLDDLYYKTGDTFGISYAIMAGMITSGSAHVAFTMNLSKSLKNIKSITVDTFKCEARGTKGYLNNTSGQFDFKNSSEYNVYSSKRGDYTLYIGITKTSAFTNADNNTPVVFTGEVKVTFN